MSKIKDWLILACYIGLIYLTLPVTPAIRDFLSAMFGSYFYSVMNLLLLTVLIAVVYAVFRHRPGHDKGFAFYFAISLLFAAYLAIIFFATPVAIEKVHLLEYGFLGFLALRVFKGMRTAWGRYVSAAVLVSVVGCCDELVQKITPGRFCQMSDIILNIVSGVLALLVLRLLESGSEASKA